MTIKRVGRFAGVALVGALALTACGSDNNSNDAAGAGASSSSCPSGTLNGEGSSAQKNAIDEAIASFGDTCSAAKVNYNPTGSGAGIKQFIAAQVDFAGSDSALNADKGEPADAAKRCKNNPAWNLPMVTGPIAVAYKLAGVDKLVVTPEVAANIFSGKITTWNDPAIAKVNPDANLPSSPIKVFFRSDESGTTENFTKWLHAAAPAAWTSDPGKKWTGKGEGKEKSAGVTDGVTNTEGGITYVEWSYAKDAKLGIAQVDNGGGPVELTADTVAKSVQTATQVGTGNDLALKLDYATKEPGAYPVILVTYEVVCSKGLEAGQTALLKSFLTHFSGTEFQATLPDLGYAPLPADLQAKVAAAVAAIN
ncbi:phosphate ABC transporter substrate-binding protein PstS [Angustibacter sp. McL0619]|uniref:phosphate ABC transporter substrate-binding protein PstS n=1 Tax=Angustibacter sp. McL0619 TaxID=3415676 RepID=UPI003CEEC7CD